MLHRFTQIYLARLDDRLAIKLDDFTYDPCASDTRSRDNDRGTLFVQSCIANLGSVILCLFAWTVLGEKRRSGTCKCCPG